MSYTKKYNKHHQSNEMKLSVHFIHMKIERKIKIGHTQKI